MRPTVTQPMVSLSWTITLLIGLVFLALGYGLRLEVEGVVDAADHSWLDLALLLCAYLFAFCLKPIQKTILRKLCQREAHRTHQKATR
ncbi:hypothetical protein [Pseudomonas orientalis]|uniref:Uncharacterized protein n=1 Tax=Pseudomonas orientalis TaxID=76758 RepID=A0A1H2ETA1_9PSED|nr:hypothetical protein [Pseudomonas orientalis]KRP67655.1 hypothetical protein TU82_02590 [Pseudomonas orientalis]SDT98386.1 hypothetical protein SAMN04490197_1686 [Pseudomonas orientalis]